MASLKQRPNSPFYYIQFKDAHGKWKTTWTKYRIGVPQDDKDARAHCAHQTAHEKSLRAANPTEKWDEWVSNFFRTRCSNPVTRGGYEQSWGWLRSYLEEIEVNVPSQLTHVHCFNYIQWRLTHGVTERKIKQSTALRDIKVLRLLMNHAVRNQWASGNPCLRMGIRREPPKEKEEFTDEQIEKIFAKLPQKEKDWRYVAFRIALETGCRLGETEIDFRNIDFKRKTITFVDPKGGKPYTTILPDSLIPMLEKVRVTKAKQSVTLPVNASTRFSNFLRKIGLKSHSFHCTRVTFITRCHRQGIEASKVMRMVNHSSETVHKIYQRLNADDLKPFANLVQFPQPK